MYPCFIHLWLVDGRTQYPSTPWQRMRQTEQGAHAHAIRAWVSAACSDFTVGVAAEPAARAYSVSPADRVASVWRNISAVAFSTLGTSCFSNACIAYVQTERDLRCMGTPSAKPGKCDAVVNERIDRPRA